MDKQMGTSTTSNLTLVVLCCVVVTSVLCSSVDPSPILIQQNFTGVARVLANRTATVWERTFGPVSAASTSGPITRAARFGIGSNSKLFTTVAVYQLQERGLLNVSDNIAAYLDAADFAAMGYPNMTTYCPQVPGNASCQVITFVQLLGMSSGIPVNIDEELMPFGGTTASTVGSSVVAPLLFIPGTAYYYSNPSFNIAAYIVEKLSGIVFSAYLQQHIFQPGNLTSTYLDVFNGQLVFDELRTGEYRQYIDNATGELISRAQCRTELDLGAVGGAGGVVSNVFDEASFYYDLFDPVSMGRPYLSNPSSVALIMKPNVLMTPVGGGAYYAQGLVVYPARSPPHRVAYVAYMGGLMCVQTANFMDLTVTPPRMAQVFSNSEVYKTSRSVFDAAVRSQTSSVFDIISNWQEAVAPFALSQYIYFDVFPLSHR